MYILKAKNNSLTHISAMASACFGRHDASYSKLLKKINTRVKTDDEIFIEGLELRELLISHEEKQQEKPRTYKLKPS